jgi:hypothetical protein
MSRKNFIIKFNEILSMDDISYEILSHGHYFIEDNILWYISPYFFDPHNLTFMSKFSFRSKMAAFTKIEQHQIHATSTFCGWISPSAHNLHCVLGTIALKLFWLFFYNCILFFTSVCNIFVPVEAIFTGFLQLAYPSKIHYQIINGIKHTMSILAWHHLVQYHIYIK